jgi:hypothetical protein
MEVCAQGADTVDSWTGGVEAKTRKQSAIGAEMEVCALRSEGRHWDGAGVYTVCQAANRGCR